MAYTSDWVDSGGLDVADGYCISLLRGVEPRAALHRLDIDDPHIVATTWAQLWDQAGQDRQHPLVPVAAFAIAGVTVLVEGLGFWGAMPEWAQPLSQGTEVVNVHRDGGSLHTVLTIVRDGEEIARIDEDDPEGLDAENETLWDELFTRLRPALKPWKDTDEPPETFDEGWLDLLQVACEHVDLAPTPDDVRGTVLGATVNELFPAEPALP
jgi:hypothetical protein